jgi:hypothetical protein
MIKSRTFLGVLKMAICFLSIRSHVQQRTHKDLCFQLFIAFAGSLPGVRGGTLSVI